MSLIDHIAELRAELAQCLLTKRERAQLEAELRRALTARATSDGQTSDTIRDVQRA